MHWQDIELQRLKVEEDNQEDKIAIRNPGNGNAWVTSNTHLEIGHWQ